MLFCQRLISDFKALEEARAGGAGLFRTEPSFIAGNRFSRREILASLHQPAFGLNGSHSVIIRTVDLGGDNPLPGFAIDREVNLPWAFKGFEISRTSPHPGFAGAGDALSGSGAGSPVYVSNDHFRRIARPGSGDG